MTRVASQFTSSRVPAYDDADPLAQFIRPRQEPDPLAKFLRPRPSATVPPALETGEPAEPEARPTQSFARRFVGQLPGAAYDVATAPLKAAGIVADEVLDVAREAPGVVADIGRFGLGPARGPQSTAADASSYEGAKSRLASDASPFYDPTAATGFQQNLAKTATGQTALRAEQGLSDIAEFGLSSASRAFGSGKLSERIHRDRAAREQFLAEAEKGGKIESLLGETGSRIYNNVVRSSAKFAAAGAAVGAGSAAAAGMKGAGRAAMYSLVTGETFDDRMANNGGDVTDALQHATVEGGITFLMGKFGQKFGFDSLEEIASPGVRAAAAKLAQPFTKRAGKALAGAGLEWSEENVIDLTRQGMELANGEREAINWRQALEAGVTGGASRAALGGIKDLASRLQNIPAQKLEETFAGVKAAEQAVDLSAAVTDAKQFIRDRPNTAATVKRSLTPEKFAELTGLTGKSNQYQESFTAALELFASRPELTKVGGADPSAQEIAAVPAIRPTAESETTPAVSTTPATPTVRESLTAAEAAAGEPGLAGRGARGAKRFIEQATPEMLEAARQPLNAREFATLTGIKKTSQVFREAFRSTLDLYANLPHAAASVQASTRPVDATQAAPAAPEPSSQPGPQIARQGPATAGAEPTAPAAPSEGVADSTTPAGTVAEAAPESPRQRRTRAQVRIESLTRRLQQARDALGTLRERTRTAATLREADLQEAMDIARLNLRAEGAGRILGTIRDARTPAGFQRFLKTVNDGLDRRERADATADFRRAVQESAEIGRPEFREKARAVVANIDTGPQRGRQRRERLEQIKQYLADNPAHPMPPRLLAALERVGKTPVAELSVDELRQATAALDSLAHFDAMKNAFLDARQQRTIDDAAKTIIEQVGHTAEPQGTVAESLAVGKAAAQAVGRAAFRPENVLDGLSPDAKHLIWERLQVEGANQERTLREKLRRPIDALLIQLGLPVDRGLVGQVTGLTERSSLVDSPLNRWRDETRAIGGVDLTRGEAAGVYLSMLDPQNAGVAQRFGFTLRPKAFGLRKRQLPINADTQAEIAEFIGAEGQAIADTIFREINTTARDAVNEAYLNVHGHILSERTDYVPRKIDHDAVQEIKGVEEFLSQSGYKSLAGSGILQARTGGGPIEVDDALDAYNRHIDTVSRIAAYLEPVRDIHAVLKRQGVREAIDAKAGPGTTDSLLDRINLQAVHSFDRTAVERGARALIRGIVPAKIALKLGPMLLQSVGLLPSAAYRRNGVSRLWESLGVLANARERYRILRAMNDHSAAARERYGGAWVREASGGLMAVRGAWRPNTLMDLATKPLEEAERQIGAVLRWKQAEGYVADELGLKPDAPMYPREVAREWERMMYRSENSSSGLEMNGAIAAGRRNAFIAPFVAFTSSASKGGSLLLHGKNQISSGDYRSGAQTYALYAASVVAAALVRKLVGRLRGKDPEDEESIAQQAVQEIAGHFPGGNEVLLPIARHVMGLNAQSDRPNVLMGQVATGVEGLRALYDAIHGEFFGELEIGDDGEPKSREKFREAADKLATAVAPLASIPYEGAKDLAKIAANAFGGGPDDSEVAKRLRAQLQDTLGESATGDERKVLFHAIRTGDDELFAKTVRAVQTKEPAKVNANWLRGVVEGRYANLRYIEGKIARGELDYQSLDDAQVEALNDLGAERQEMLDALYEMIQRNL